MSESRAVSFPEVFFISFAVLMIGYGIGGCTAGEVAKRIQREGVERGYAEWLINESGVNEWRWKGGK